VHTTVADNNGHLVVIDYLVLDCAALALCSAAQRCTALIQRSAVQVETAVKGADGVATM